MSYVPEKNEKTVLKNNTGYNTKIYLLLLKKDKATYKKRMNKEAETWSFSLLSEFL